MNLDTNGLELGDTARDTVTGVTGVVTGFHIYMTGCARASIQQPVKADGTLPDAYSSDVLSLELVKAGPRHEETPPPSRKGGPRRDPAQSFHRP